MLCKLNAVKKLARLNDYIHSSGISTVSWHCGELHGDISSWFLVELGYIQLGKRAGNQQVDTMDTVSDAIQ